MRAVLHGLSCSTGGRRSGRLLFSMARSLCADIPRAAIALAPPPPGAAPRPVRRSPRPIGSHGAGRARQDGCSRREVRPEPARCRSTGVSMRLGGVLFGTVCVLLLLLPVLGRKQRHAGWAALDAIFYRSGALVFGGGHVVLPLLRDVRWYRARLVFLSTRLSHGPTALLWRFRGPLFTIAACAVACRLCPRGLRAPWAAGATGGNLPGPACCLRSPAYCFSTDWHGARAERCRCSPASMPPSSEFSARPSTTRSVRPQSAAAVPMPRSRRQARCHLILASGLARAHRGALRGRGRWGLFLATLISRASRCLGTIPAILYVSSGLSSW